MNMVVRYDVGFGEAPIVLDQFRREESPTGSTELGYASRRQAKLALTV
jgi:hypothetical protein